MKNLGRIIVACSLALTTIFTTTSAQPLTSGQPIKSGENEGLSPLWFGMTYSNRPKGFAYISSEEYPDIFVWISAGFPEVRNCIFRCPFEKVGEDGSLIYGAPEEVMLPWEKKAKGKPSNFTIWQNGKGGDTYGIWMSSKKAFVAKLHPSGNFFTEVEEMAVEGTGGVGGLEMWSNDGRIVDYVVLSGDNAKYRPEDTKEDMAVSYYDGASIYRGELPYSGIFHSSFDLKSKVLTDDYTPITPDNKAILSGSGVMRVVDKKRGLDGYIMSSTLGSLKYVPARKSDEYGYVRNSEGEVLTHPTYGAKSMSFPSADGTRCDMIIGGEGAIYHYRFLGMDKESGMPKYAEPKVVLQRNADLFSGSLTVPNVVDWDSDGVLDIVSGNSEGRLLFFKNNGTNREPAFAMSQPVYAAGEPICIRPGYHVVQGPLEASWGYLCPMVVDWNGDGLLDVVTSGSKAKYELLLNEGTPTEPKLAAPRPISCDNLELWGTWRVRPAIAEIDGKMAMVTMDDDNELHLYYRVDDYNVADAGKLKLKNGQHISGHNQNNERYGQKGRGKLAFVDWDSDGKLDLLIGSVKRSSYPSPERGLPFVRFKRKQTGMQVMLLRNVGSNKNMKFEEPVQLQFRGEDFYLGAHSNAPTPCMLGDTSGGVNLLVGCESGKFFFFEHGDITTVTMDEKKSK